MEKTFKGKALYQPAGKAAEYSKWAVNLFNGCSAKCDYCYNRHGITAKVLGADKPTLKKCLFDEDNALKIFIMEVDKNADALRKHGLFFNFVSDPFLPETIVLNTSAILYCLGHEIPVKTLTKQTWWLEEFLKGMDEQLDANPRLWNNRYLWAFGFTLTGHDELEPGAAPNMDRIRAMKVLNDEGFKTWASIEPIIDLESSLTMIRETVGHCDLYKIGLQSGKKYDRTALEGFMNEVARYTAGEYPIYFKDSILKAARIPREDLPTDIFVSRDYNMFKD